MLVNDNSTGNDQIIARPGITTVADLKGKKVAAEQGTVDHYLLLLALQKAGLTEKDVEFTPLLTDAAAAAFVAGKVDAVGAFAPFTTTALGLAGSKAIATSEDFPGAIPDHLVFGSDFVREHPTEVQAMVQTWFDTTAWIKANPDEAIDDHGQARRRQRRRLQELRRRYDDLLPPAEPGRLRPGQHAGATWTTRRSRSATSWSRPAWPTRSRRWTGCSSPSSCRP